MQSARRVQVADLLTLGILLCSLTACDLGPRRPAADSTPVASTPISVEPAATSTAPAEPDAVAPTQALEDAGTTDADLPGEDPFPLWYPAPTPDADTAVFSARVREAIAGRSVPELRALVDPLQYEMYVVHLPSRGTDRISTTLGISNLARVDLPRDAPPIVFEPLPASLAGLPDALRRVQMELFTTGYVLDVIDALFCSGWGDDGLGEAVVIVMEPFYEGGPPILAGYILAPSGFDQLPPAGDPSTRHVTWRGDDGALYGLDIPASWHVHGTDGERLEILSHFVMQERPPRESDAGSRDSEVELFPADALSDWDDYVTWPAEFLAMTPPPPLNLRRIIGGTDQPRDLPPANSSLFEVVTLSSGEEAVLAGEAYDDGLAVVILSVDMGGHGVAEMHCSSASLDVCLQVARSLRVESASRRPTPTPDAIRQEREAIRATAEAEATRAAP